jgi:drug/metabolite transporter (DMT)-like permease
VVQDEILMLQIIPLLIGIIGISVQSIGFTLQKIGLSKYSTVKQFIHSDKFSLWILGTVFAFLGALTFFLALTYSSLSTIQPIIGIGPAVVTIFGFVILKTKLHKNEAIGIGLTVVGIFFLSFELNPTVSYLNINEVDFLMIAIIIIASFVTVTNILYRLKYYDVGIEEGLISGVFGGFSSIFGKIGIEKLLNQEIHWALLVLLFTQIISFLFFQKGLQRGKMEKVVSVFTGMAILLPILIGLLFFGETLNVVNIIGVIIIISGAFLLAKKYSTLITSS